MHSWIKSEDKDLRLKTANHLAAGGVTVWPRSIDPIYVVGYYINGSILLGHTVPVIWNDEVGVDDGEEGVNGEPQEAP